MTPIDTPQTHRCRAGTETARCDFRGTREELREHADEVGHPRCIVCADALAWHEQQSCGRCVSRVRDDLDAVAVAFAHLERVIGQAAYRGIAWDALALAADGSLANPQQPNQYTQPRAVAPTVHVEHRELVGDEVTLPGYVEERIPSDGREHVRDHWTKDPMSVLAFLEHQERDWRHEFGHPPATDVASVVGCLAYLRDWHMLAARTHPGFDDYATEVAELRGRLEHVVGLADDPVTAPIPCACGGRLERRYAERTGSSNGGLPDLWTCRACGTGYGSDDYVWRLRLLTEEPGWVSVERAAASTGRTTATVWAWVTSLAVPSMCSRVTRRVVVELDAVAERSAATARQWRRPA